MKFLISQKKRAGHEFDLIKYRGKIVGLNPTHPLLRLLHKKKIKVEHIQAAREYSIDYEQANLTNHARPSYCVRVAGGKARDCDLTDKQLRAKKRIDEVHKEIAGSFGYKAKRYFDVLGHVFVEQKAIRAVQNITSIHRDCIENIAVELCDILLHFYNRDQKKCVDKIRPFF